MSVVRGFTPYSLLNPNDDEEGQQTFFPKVAKPKLKATTPSVTAHKKSEKKSVVSDKTGVEAKSKSQVKSHQTREPISKPRKPRNDYTHPIKEQDATGTDEVSQRQDMPPIGREQRVPPHISKRRDRPSRSQIAAGYGANLQTRRTSIPRKDSLKKEVSGKSTWGHPIESQKGVEDEAEAEKQSPADGTTSDSEPRKPSRYSKTFSDNRTYHKKSAHQHEDGKDETGDRELHDNSSRRTNDDPQQTSEKGASVPKPVESKPVQLTFEEYMASKGSSNTGTEEPVKKSKGLYVASDDSDWAGMAISSPQPPVKDQLQKNEKKKHPVNKSKSQKVVLTFDDSQPISYNSEPHGHFRPTRGRGQGMNQREPRRPRSEYHDNQDRGQKRYPNGQRSSAITTHPDSDKQVVDKQSEVPTAPPLQDKVDPKERFSIDFPAL